MADHMDLAEDRLQEEEANLIQLVEVHDADGHTHRHSFAISAVGNTVFRQEEVDAKLVQDNSRLRRSQPAEAVQLLRYLLEQVVSLLVYTA